MQQATERVAGRELDAEIAEKVMGETVYPDHGPSNMHGVTPYSTDIAAAWLVVERFSPKAFHMTRNGRLWEVSFSPLTTCEILESMGIAESAPLAICLAALTAISN